MEQYRKSKKTSCCSSVRRLTIFLGTVFSICINIYAAGNGNSLLSAAIKKIDSAPSISAKFVMDEGGNKTEGKVYASGRCFAIETTNGNFETWYDGKTQWTWSRMTGEVNITEPTADELLESNPFAVIKASASGYNAAISEKKNGITMLSLTPKEGKKSNISKMELKLSDSSNLPVSLKVTTSDRQNITFTFSDINISKAIPSTEFKYKREYHPESEIIDLR